jgi:hypothetical protein
MHSRYFCNSGEALANVSRPSRTIGGNTKEV